MKVRDAMTAHPVTCAPETTLRDAARMMRETDCGALPVVGPDGYPIGVVTDRDITIRAVAEGAGGDSRVELCMSMPAFTVGEDDELGQCIEMLEERQIRRAIVVDGDGHCSGMIAVADIASHASKRTTGELTEMVSRPPHPSMAV